MKKNRVKEALVSYKVAELLKECGFDEACYSYYDSEGKLLQYEYGYNKLPNSSTAEGYCTAPTQQLVLCWLRELYNLHIYAFYSKIDSLPDLPCWCFEVEKIDGDWTYSRRHGKTYEECINEAINYTLKNYLNKDPI